MRYGRLRRVEAGCNVRSRPTIVIDFSTGHPDSANHGRYIRFEERDEELMATRKPNLDVSSGRRTGRPSEPVVSKDEVLITALRLIDEVGLSEFSVRMLAREMGVSPSAFYYHFVDKDEILSGVVQRVVGVLRPPKQQPTWQDYMVESMVLMRRALLEHPNLMPLLATRPWTIASHRMLDEVLRFMGEGGVPTDHQLLLNRAAESIAFGSAMMGEHLTGAYGEISPEHSYLRRAVNEDRFTDADQSYRAICEALVIGLTATMLGTRFA